MILTNILELIGVAAAYLLLFALLPFWLRGFRLSQNGALDRLVDCFLRMHVIIILLVIGLALLGIYGRLSLTLSLLLMMAGYLALRRRARVVRTLRDARRLSRMVIDGYYHPRLLLRKLRQRTSGFFTSIVRRIDHPIALIFTVLIFAYGAYTRCYATTTSLFFSTSDMYLHTEWAKMLMNNTPYFAGVYPFGFHAVMAATADLFGMNVVTVMRLMSSVIGILMLFSMYYTLRRTMRSTFAVNAAMVLYVVSSVFPYWAMERQYLAAPQELGTIFLYLTAYFLYKFIRDRETRDLISFCAAVALTLMIHFFVTIFAVLICGAVFVSCLALMKWKTFRRLVLGVVCALAIAMAPLVGGLVKGIPFNGSMNWALSFFVEGIEVEGVEEVEEAEPTPISQVISRLAEEGYFQIDYAESPLNLGWLLPFLASAVVAMAAPAFRPKKGGRPWIFPAYAMYAVLMMILYVFSALNVFTLMEYSRLYVYFIYAVPLVMAVPIEMLYRLLYEAGKRARMAYVAITCAVGVAFGTWMVAADRFMPLGRVWQAQYNGAVQAYYNIISEFPRYSWTMVSSMSEYSQCLNEGYHYEMADFMRQMDAADEEVSLTTENVFIYVVKRPNRYLDTDLQRLGDFEVLPEYNPEDVTLDLTDAYARGTLFTYRDYATNSAMQAKVAAWAEEYLRYYPDEMTVYYEDDEIVVYRCKQNVYAPNQFIIPYAGNNYKRLEVTK